MAGGNQPVAVGSRVELLTSTRLSQIYGRPIAVRTVDGHTVIFVEPDKGPGPA
jgi:ABC-type cobalamin transport system ATPase subunit